MFLIRQCIADDKPKILELYRKVARRSGGIARSESEITMEYISNFTQEALNSGVHFVAEAPANPHTVIGEIHGYKMVPKVFDHVISELTVAVDPDFHGRGIGKLLFRFFLEHIRKNRPDVLRVELVTQESNARALSLYTSVGFVTEGRLQHRIRMRGETLDADIPMAWFNPSYASGL